MSSEAIVVDINTSPAGEDTFLADVTILKDEVSIFEGSILVSTEEGEETVEEYIKEIYLPDMRVNDKRLRDIEFPWEHVEQIEPPEPEEPEELDEPEEPTEEPEGEPEPDEELDEEEEIGGEEDEEESENEGEV